MAELDFTQQDKYDLDAPMAMEVVAPTHMDREIAGYASILNGGDPLAQYRQIMTDIEYNGKSGHLTSIISKLKTEENQQLKQDVARIIQDPNIPQEERRNALFYYEQNKDVLPSLKDIYTVNVASTNPAAPDSMEDFLAGMQEKEQTIATIQQERNSDASKWSGTVWSGLGGLLLEIIPFAGTAYKGYQLSEIQKAIDGEDYGFLGMVWDGIWQGDKEAKIRKLLEEIPTSEGKLNAARNILKVVKDLPGTDYNKYTAIQSSLDGNLEDWQKTVVNLAGLLGAAIGGAQIAKTLGKTAKVTTSVNPDTILGRTAVHNPEVAGQLAGRAIVDETGDIAAGLGTKQSEIVADMLPKIDEEVGAAINTEATTATRAIVQGIDQAGQESLDLTRKAYSLYPEELMNELSTAIQTTVSNTRNAIVHLGKSSFNITEDGINGTAVFGKTDTAPFQTYQEALEAAKLLAPELPEGVVSVVKPRPGGKLGPAYATTTTKGNYYLQFKYNKEVTPQDIVLFGPDAVKIRFDLFGREVKAVSDLLTRVALSGGKVGSYLFAHHAMPQKAASAAFTAFDKALRVEEPFLTYARRFVAKQTPENRRFVSEILKEGEDFSDEAGNLGKVFTYDEVIKKGLAKGMSQSQAEEAAQGYYVYRRIADWMYTLADRSRTRQLRSEGYSWVDSPSGRFIGKSASYSEVEGVRAVVDKSSGSVVSLSKKTLDDMYEQGESLVRLATPYRKGDELVQFARVGKQIDMAELDGGTIPYIKGYVPRGYENNYFVVRTPKEVTKNGVKFTDRGTLEGSRTTHAAADSKQEADALVAKLQKEDPTGIYSVKRDRLSEKSILDQADVFRQNLVHSNKRGEEALLGGKQVDPLVGLLSLVQSLSRKTALEDFLTITKRDFVKNYDEFLAEKGVFPSSADKIIAKANMTMDESKRFKEARSLYNWLEGMMIMQRYDAGIWKDSMYAAGEFAEKFSPVFAKMLRGLGDHYPVDMLRKISTAFFISLRPARQVLLQPSQLMLYSSIDPKLINPIEGIRFMGKIGALGFAKFYKNGSMLGQAIPDELIIKAGAKMFYQTEAEFRKTLEAFANSGLLQSIDSNLLVDGLYSQKHKKLVETATESLSRNAAASAGVIPRIGRQLGFDRGEEINLAGSWIIARDRFIKMNPTLDPNTKAAAETIASTARELAFSMTRPGSFQYQRNALSMPLQFIAAPHKALLSFTTSKTLTAQEKARLMAAHFVLYGTAGLGIQKFVMGESQYGVPGLNLRGKYGDKMSEEFFLAVEGGLADWGVNKTANFLLDNEDEKTRLNISGSFSPIGGGLLPFGEFLNSLSEDPFATTVLGPSWNIVDPKKGRIVTAIRDISMMMRGDEDTKKSFADIALRATEIASGGTDWMKYRIARDYDLIVASNGYPIADKVTAAESVAKIFGIATIREGVAYEQIKKFRDEDKEIEDAVDYIYKGFQKIAPLYKDNPELVQQRNAEVSAYMSTIQDPLLKRKMQEAFRKKVDQQLRTVGSSIQTEMYYGAFDRSQEQLKNHFNVMKSYGMEEADTLKEIMGEE